MFGLFRKLRGGTQSHQPALAQALIDRIDKLLVENASVRLEVKRELQGVTKEVHELVSIAKGEPFAALHKWISQSTEREEHARENERAYVNRWREHAKSLSEQVEFLKLQLRKPKAEILITLREPSGRMWHAIMEDIDWEFPFPVGTTFEVKLWGKVHVSPKVTEIRCTRKLHPEDNCGLWMTLVTEVVDVPEITEKELDVLWRRRFIMSELKNNEPV